MNAHDEEMNFVVGYRNDGPEGLNAPESPLLFLRAHSQIVNELYGSTIHLCYKKAGASLAVIQQVAEKTAERTAKQVRNNQAYGAIERLA